MVERKEHTMKRINLFLIGCMALGLAWFGAPGGANASGGLWELEPTESPLVGHYRSIGAVRALFFTGLPDLAGASVSISFLRPLDFEGGVATLGLAWTAYGRLGWAFNLVEKRNLSGYGASLHLLVQAGYRYFSGTVFGSQDVSHSLTGNLALEGTWWLARHFGLTAQLSAGGGWWFMGRNNNDLPLYPDLRFSLGFAF
jgi:hypothetical protein